MDPVEEDDKVTCVDSTGFEQMLTVGKVYSILEVTRSPLSGRPMYSVGCDDGEPAAFYTSRFLPVQSNNDDQSDPMDKEVNAQGYPDGNPKTRIGLTKPSFANIPPVALIHLGAAMSDGAKKYGRMNWREHAVTSSVYYDAAMRHMQAFWDGEDIAADSKVDHLGHAMACMAIILDARESGKLNDDRPIPGHFSQVVKANTKEIK
jgi:hypothetical protein